jgi:hypothetical protein
MTTKPPSAVQEFLAETLEKKAYSSVSTIETEEPNDRNRLGYHIWRWLTERQGTLEQAVSESGARLRMTTGEAARIIREGLTKQGIQV